MIIATIMKHRWERKKDGPCER